MIGLLAGSIVAALAVAPSPAPLAAGARWTRVRATSSASCEVLARALARPDLPYPYFTTYVLRGTSRPRAASCVIPAHRGDGRRRPPAPGGGCGAK